MDRWTEIFFSVFYRTCSAIGSTASHALISNIILNNLLLTFGNLLVQLLIEPDGFTSGSIGLYGNSRCSLWVCVCVCLSVCDAWVCTDHEIYVVAVIVAS